MWQFATWIVAYITLLTFLPKQSAAFTTPSCLARRSAPITKLHANLFDDLKNFFGGNADDDNDEEEDELPAGTYRVATIPVSSIKPGGLRLFMMFYLMGEQNTPERNSWRADQPTREEYVVDFWFHDQSAVLSLCFSDEKITIDRIGSNPSNIYLMQETVIVDGILDELHKCASDDAIPEPDRLLLCERDAIDKARSALAFG